MGASVVMPDNVVNLRCNNPFQTPPYRVYPIIMRLSRTRRCCIASNPGDRKSSVFRQAGHAILDTRHRYDNVGHSI